MPIDPVLVQIRALRERLDLIWSNHEREHAAHDKAHEREHNFAQDAIDKAAEMAKTNKADANEWRATMTDRETKFATKDDVGAILGRLDAIERAAILSEERDRQRIVNDAAEKRDAERRQARSQWTIGIVVGLMASVGAVLINLVIRLLT